MQRSRATAQYPESAGFQSLRPEIIHPGETRKIEETEALRVSLISYTDDDDDEFDPFEDGNDEPSDEDDDDDDEYEEELNAYDD